MTHSEAREALRESSFYNCIVARLHAHEHSRGVSWGVTGTWSLARYKEVAANPCHLKRLKELDAIERK